GVGLGDVQAERDDERLRVDLPDDRQRVVEGLEVAGVVHVLGQGEVEVVPLAFSFTDLVGKPGEVRVGEARVAVDRDGQDVGAVVEDVLGAVAAGGAAARAG